MYGNRSISFKASGRFLHNPSFFLLVLAIYFISWLHYLTFRYGALASETICTENFTPWRKLLPCKQVCFSSTFLNSDNFSKTLSHAIIELFYVGQR